jgi:hypothetical protein
MDFVTRQRMMALVMGQHLRALEESGQDEARYAIRGRARVRVEVRQMEVRIHGE